MRPYSLSDLKRIASWLEARGMDAGMVDALPRVGFVTDTAAGFLREVEGGYGIIDSLVADPKSNREVRSRDLNDIIAKLIATAQEMKMKGLLAYCGLQGTIDRARSHGFKAQEYSVLTLKF